jgi:hypothetical protein
MRDWTGASCERYGSSLGSSRSGCGVSGAYHRRPSFFPLFSFPFLRVFVFAICVCRDECDPDGAGSLDREAFVRGMARIDEELRRAQLLGRARAPRPVASRPILR